MFVKICGITNEDDALLAVALGADAVGFVFAPSVRQIAVQKVYDITRRLPPEVLTVGVFRDEHPKRVIEMVQSSGIKAAQLHGHESPADVTAVSLHVRTVIKAVTAGTIDGTRAGDFATKMILVDAPEPGSGEVFDWKMAAELPEGLHLILAGGLTPENVANGISIVRPWGVDVSSGVESQPGRKDPILMKRFIENAKAAEPAEYDGGTFIPYDWRDE
ncbi:MAG: phosphoribosylanthranilate isomerase [Actinobacteria bacterium]|uniref:phosphoribosylanthranilate isomerase n=1 Tax=freshwater metagenome TaxID=449393 RepID=A0A6J6LWQ2_9ZZZZ|nr:phosphoribosylanthranilate isomerase [Actinomycetota bacterium]